MNVEDAVRESIKAFASVFGQTPQSDVRLEEVTLNDDESLWLTTVSYPNPDLPNVPASGSSVSFVEAYLNPSPKKRIYKTIRLRADDGRLIGISNAA